MLNTPEWLDHYKELIASGQSQRQACAILNIARSTVQDTLKRIEQKEEMISGKKPKGMRVLLFDIESAPHLGYFWQRWKQNIGSNQIEKEGGYILTAAWKWLGEDEVHHVCAADPINGDDSNICATLYEVIEEADAIVAHNNSAFDYPMLNARLVQNGFRPLKSVKKIDTLQIAKKNFRFASNRLDDLGKFLGVGRKIDTGGFELWHRVIKGEKAAMLEMVEYNKQDVLLLEKVYLKLRAFDSNLQANAGHYYHDNLSRCPCCGSSDVTESGNFAYTPVSIFVEMVCTDCGHRSRKRQAINDKEKRANMLVTPK